MRKKNVRFQIPIVVDALGDVQYSVIGSYTFSDLFRPPDVKPQMSFPARIFAPQFSQLAPKGFPYMRAHEKWSGFPQLGHGQKPSKMLATKDTSEAMQTIGKVTYSNAIGGNRQSVKQTITSCATTIPAAQQPLAKKSHLK